MLDERKELSVEHAAAELGCSRRTVYRDFLVLSETGVPLYQEPEGRRVRWRLVDGPKRRLSITLSFSEMLALTAGRDLLAGLTGTFFHEAAISALEKIRAALPEPLLSRADASAELVMADKRPLRDYREWLIIQQVDEIMNFLPDQDGKAKMIIVKPAAANAVMGSGYDSGNQQIQKYIDEDIALAKTELGLTADDIIQIATFFNGSGTNYAPNWSNPVNSVYVNGTFMIGKTDTPAQIKTDIEKKLNAIGVNVAWVDDGEYNAGMGNVHCGTNTKKTPICKRFTDCL